MKWYRKEIIYKDTYKYLDILLVSSSDDIPTYLVPANGQLTCSCFSCTRAIKKYQISPLILKQFNLYSVYSSGELIPTPYTV